MSTLHDGPARPRENASLTAGALRKPPKSPVGGAKKGRTGVFGVRWIDLAAGLPAAVIAAAMVGLLVQGVRRSTLTPEYLAEATRLFDQQDYRSAAVAFKRLASMNPERDDYRMALALAYEKIGEEGRAESLARSLANRENGYFAAQFWLAARILSHPPLDKDRIEIAEFYLLRVHAAAPSDLRVQAMLGKLYAGTGRGPKARPYLEASAGGDPELLLTLANICKSMGDPEESRRRANSALEIAKKGVAANPDDASQQLLWASALAVLEDFPGALDMLDKIKPGKGDAVVLKDKITLSVAWEETLRRTNADPALRLAAIDRGLKADPGNVPLFLRLAELTLVEGETAEKVRARIKSIKDKDGKTPALVQYAQANDAWHQGRLDEAREGWEKALHEEPRLTLAANNLAWSLAHKEPRDVKRAISLIDQAIAQTRARKPPQEDPRYHGTRGQILVQLGRWQESAAELEAVVNGGFGTPGLYGSLADAYDHLDKPNEAARFRKLAREK